jgi:signal-transduction protein with cAMP-binding, CBS, and nucleotidyltransferase domain
MNAGDLLRRSGVALDASATVRTGAELMEQAGIGCVVIVDDARRPIGVVTDRDLVRRVLANGFPSDARIDSVMSTPVVGVDETADAHSVFAVFRSNAVRRLVVTRDGEFVGVLTIDDLLMDLSADLADLARPVTAETLFAHRDSPPPVRL